MNAQTPEEEKKEEIVVEKEPVVFFKYPQFQQSEELYEFLKKIITWTPRNSLCIDCRQNNSTHCLIWLGAFVCKTCAIKHQNMSNWS